MLLLVCWLVFTPAFNFQEPGISPAFFFGGIMEILTIFSNFLFAPLDLFVPGSDILYLCLAGLVPLCVVVFVREVIRWCMSL